MSTVIDPKPLTVAQRTTEAVRKAADMMAVDDVKRMGAALVEAALEQMHQDAAFSVRVRNLYDAMAAPKKATGAHTRRKAGHVELVPIRQIDIEINPAAPPDPYFLLDLYGPAQLALALQPYTAARLRETMKQVQQRNPGTKPDGPSKQQLIEYIVRFAINGRG